MKYSIRYDPKTNTFLEFVNDQEVRQLTPEEAKMVYEEWANTYPDYRLQINSEEK